MAAIAWARLPVVPEACWGLLPAHDACGQGRAPAKGRRGLAAGPRLGSAALLRRSACVQNIEEAGLSRWKPAATFLQVKAVREAAGAAGAALVASINAHAVKAATGLLLAGTEQGLKWQARAGALKLLGSLAKRAPSVSTACRPRCMCCSVRAPPPPLGRRLFWLRLRSGGAFRPWLRPAACSTPLSVDRPARALPPSCFAAQEFAHCMVAVVPRVSECMVDIRPEASPPPV